MHKTFLLPTILVILLLSTAINAFGGLEPSPWKQPMKNDLQLFQQEIAAATAKLAGAEPGANLAELGLIRSHENLRNLLLSLRTKVKALQKTKNIKNQTQKMCNDIKQKLAGLDLSLRNFLAAIKANDAAAVQNLLDEMQETAKSLEELIAK